VPRKERGMDEKGDIQEFDGPDVKHPIPASEAIVGAICFCDLSKICKKDFAETRSHAAAGHFANSC